MHNVYQTTGPRRPVFFTQRRWLPLLAAIAAALILCAPAAAQRTLLPTTDLKIAGHAITAEIAATESSRNYGLMNRESLPANHGMLFVFERPALVCFWMKNTGLPLSIAFINDQGKVTNISRMQPNTLDTHCPVRPVRFALEMSQGWFSERDIRPGARVDGLPPAGGNR